MEAKVMHNRGYMGKILTVDLSSGRIGERDLGEEEARQYLGGSGLGTKILMDNKTYSCDPLAPENLLVFATGPLTGTGLFNSDRFEVITKSPLTGIYAESSAGGYWGGRFKRCGYDALIITGKAEKPVYLFITEGRAQIKDASNLWGLDTFTATDALKAAEGEDAKAAVIGPAGENLVKIAGIVSDGRHGRVAGRCGVGAVMGSKLLKAVVVKGSRKVEVFNREAVISANKRMAQIIPQNTQGMMDGGTGVGLEASEELGNLPVQNWLGGDWKRGAGKITGLTLAKSHLVKTYNCGSCMIKCGRIVKSVSGPYKGQEIAGPEYETLGLLGSNLLEEDPDSIITSNELCNRYGLDTISTGGVIGFALEAFERGLLTSKDFEGEDLRWGDSLQIHKLIEAIAYRRGIGTVLGEGVKKAAESLGPLAEEFSAHIKGLEPPAHDGRAKFTAAIGMATSARGACHLSGFAHDFEEGAVLPDLGSPPLTNRFTPVGKAENVFRMQNLMGLFDSLVICKFALFGGLTVDPLVEVLRGVTGWDMDREEFFLAGERIFNLKRIFNNKLGITRKDDTLPLRMLRSRRGGGTEVLPPLFEMLGEYYQYRGWDEFGRPNRDKVRQLGLEAYAHAEG